MDWWRCHRKAFSASDCARIVERAMAYPSREGTVGYGGTKKIGVTKGVRNSTIRWIHREDQSMLWAFLRLERILLESNEVAFGLDICGLCGGFHGVQFTEYHAEGEQHYDWHEDNNWKRNAPMDRKLSLVVQLSERGDYDGGKLELKNDPLPEGMFCEQGDVIVFPSFNRHRVTPVTRGVRYSLVTWALGPRLR
jgi:PKHD-type hydroxylase